MDQTPASRDGQEQHAPRAPRVVRPRNTSQEPEAYVQPGRQPIRRRVEQNPYVAHTRDEQRLARENSTTPPNRDNGWGQDQEKPNSKKKKSHPFISATIIFLCLIFIASIGLFMAPQLLGFIWKDMPNFAFVNGGVIARDNSQYSDYKQYRQYMDSQTIFPGVYIDGLHVGEMTIDEARVALESVASQAASDFSVTVAIANGSWVINSQRVPVTRNMESVLQQAFAYGRQNTTLIRGTKVTPFQERLNTALAMRQEAVALYTEMTYDKATVRELTDYIASTINKAAMDASVQSFNFNTRAFTFTEEEKGIAVDAEAIYQRVIGKLDAREYGATLTFQPQEIMPKITKVELMNSYRQIASFTTETTSNKNRNTNISLSSQAINGITVMPGDTFSFNETTGQRTEAKGYKEAIAISGGQNVPDVGGGVCQTSSTLFNAVSRADLEIVYRSPHAWPSSYVGKGMDATVNWPNLDFKFKNNKETPIFIVASYASQKIMVEIYGVSLGDGITIDLESEVTKTTKPPSDTAYVKNTKLASGTQRDTIKARTGYEVDTYKVWYENGKETKRELYCTSKYRMYQNTVEYND